MPDKRDVNQGISRPYLRHPGALYARAGEYIVFDMQMLHFLRAKDGNEYL